jgi:hypothetical protein
MTTELRGSRQIRLWTSVWKPDLPEPTLGNLVKGANSMTDSTFAQRRITSATAIGMNALRPILHFQVSMLRMWADGIERFACNYEKGLEETATIVKEQSDKQSAA